MRSDENDQKTIKKLDDAVKTIETLLDDPQWHKTAESEIEVMANYAAYFSPAKAPSDGIIDWARKTTEHENANEIRARVKLAGEQQLAQKEEGTNDNQSNTSQPLNEPSDSTTTD